MLPADYALLSGGGFTAGGRRVTASSGFVSPFLLLPTRIALPTAPPAGPRGSRVAGFGPAAPGSGPCRAAALRAGSTALRPGWPAPGGSRPRGWWSRAERGPWALW